MTYAKIDSSQNVISIIRPSSVDSLLNRRINDGESFVPVTKNEANAFELNPKAKFIDGVFTLMELDPIPEPQEPTLEDIRQQKIKELERYTPRFVSCGPSGSVRYTKEKQSSFGAIYSRCERLIRIPETPQEIKAACEAKIALIESVYAWIKSVLAQHYVTLNALKAAETLEELDAVTWDYSDLNATDPDVWLEHVI